MNETDDPDSAGSPLPETPPELATLFFDRSPDPAALVDAAGRLVACNGAAESAGTGTPAPEAAPRDELPPFWTNQGERERILLAAAKDDGRRNMEIRLRPGDGSPERLFLVSVRRVDRIDDSLILLAARELTDVLTPRALALTQGTPRTGSFLLRDPGTGFLTREAFQVLLEQAVASAARQDGTLAVASFDLDDFKAMNDAHGMAAGDEYLRRLGEALRRAARPDTVFGRTGGDEFAILFPRTGAAEASIEVESVLQFVGQFGPRFAGRTLRLNASFGVALYPDHGASAADLMLAAELAQSQAKRRGGGRFVFYDSASREREQIGLLRGQADRIHAALADSRFVPVFQPIAEVSTLKIVGVETLVRLKEEDGSLTSPASFLGAAERFGLITAIDRLVIAQAFDAFSGARRRIDPDLELSINLSASDFEDDSLVADISMMARTKGIRPSRVTFELTETAALRDFGRVQAFTGALTSEGFRFALDDFGIGFSSFRYLRDLPVSTLKFDQSYVRHLTSRAEDRVFVRGVAEICRGLGVKTVAEGVEAPGLMTVLRELGIDRAQGYLIGMPEPELPKAHGPDSKP